VSQDYGLTWHTRDSVRTWVGAGVSGDGRIMLAADYGTQIHVSAPQTTAGTSGYLTGGRDAAVALQYLGGGTWRVLYAAGVITPF